MKRFAFNLKTALGLLFVLFILGSCEQEPKSWQLLNSIQLDDVHPIGLAHTPDGLWLSDGDHNRLVRIDSQGNIVQRIDSLERPMHIWADGYELLIPLYGNDQVLRWKEEIVKSIAFSDSLDAPAGVYRKGT
jgi:hypothetical protein